MAMSDWTITGEKPTGETVEQTADSRSEAETVAANARDLGLSDIEIVPPETDIDERTDGGQQPEVLDAEAVSEDVAAEARDLPDRSVGQDPIDWVPTEFVDEIDGSQAINRKGFEVLSHFYDVSVSTEIVVPPEETGHEYCRAIATATTADGRECVAHGSAHVDRGDDSYLLLEMADTRARKRSLSIATGVGAVAVEELKEGVSQ